MMACSRKAKPVASAAARIMQPRMIHTCAASSGARPSARKPWAITSRPNRVPVVIKMMSAPDSGMDSSATSTKSASGPLKN